MSGHLAKNTLFMTAASIFQKMIAFVYFLFLARVMMPEKTGVFFLATSIVTMFSVFTDLGITSIVIRESAKYPDKRTEMVRRSLALKIVFVLIACLIIYIASLLFRYDATTTRLIWITTIVMAIDAFALLCYGILRGSQLLKYEAIGMFLGQLVTVTIGTVSLIIHPDLMFLVLALICGSFTNLAIASKTVVRLYGGWSIFFPTWNWNASKRLLFVMVPFAIAGIFTKIYSNIDIVLISKLLNTTAVGIYSIAYKFTYAFQFLPLAFSAALYPNLSATIENDPETTTKTVSKAIWYILLMACPIVFGIWLVAPQMVRLTGHGYVESVPVLQLLIFVLFPSFLEVPFGALLNAADKQKTRMVIMGIAMLVNTGLDLLFIPAYGIFGSAIGSIISYSFMVFLECLTIARLLPHLFSRTLFFTVSRVVLSGILMLFIGLFLKSFLHWVLLIPLSACVYVFFLFMTKSIHFKDVARFRSMFRKTQPVVYE